MYSEIRELGQHSPSQNQRGNSKHSLNSHRSKIKSTFLEHWNTNNPEADGCGGHRYIGQQNTRLIQCFMQRLGLVLDKTSKEVTLLMFIDDSTIRGWTLSFRISSKLSSPSSRVVEFLPRPRFLLQNTEQQISGHIGATPRNRPSEIWEFFLDITMPRFESTRWFVTIRQQPNASITLILQPRF